MYDESRMNPTKVKVKHSHGCGFYLGMFATLVAAALATIWIVLFIIGTLWQASMDGIYGSDNARCKVCGKEWQISEEYRGNISQWTRDFYCPRCHTEWLAGSLYANYREHHSKRQEKPQSQPKKEASSPEFVG